MYDAKLQDELIRISKLKPFEVIMEKDVREFYEPQPLFTIKITQVIDEHISKKYEIEVFKKNEKKVLDYLIKIK